MTDAETKQWAEYGQAMAAYQRAEADRKAAEDARLAEAKAARRRALRRWSGQQAAARRWGQDRERTRRVKLFASDADALARLARERGCTIADAVRGLLAGVASVAR